MEPEAVGQRLARLRGEMTQADLAEIGEVDQSVISKIEKGRAGMSPELAQRLAAHFGVTAGYMMFGEENPDLLAYRSTVLLEVASALQQMARLSATDRQPADPEAAAKLALAPGYVDQTPAGQAKSRKRNR